jgi:NarL family two-component system response regulator LiaR
MVSLLIADDHQLFRRGLRQLCEINGGFTVLAEAETGEQAVALAREHQPDVILMDIRMAGITGVEASRQILQENPAARILMLTMYRQDQYVINALKAGAAGYLLKECSEETLFAAIHAVYRGEGWIDAPVTAAVLAQFSGAGEAQSELASLTETELEILRMVARGAENQAIADQLNLSKGTVANYLREIFSKLNVSNRTEAALFALRHGWASLNPED